MTGVTAVVIPYQDVRGALGRINRLVEALRHCKLKAEIIAIDNSPRRSWQLAAAVEDNGSFPGRYRWQGGRNLCYGPAMNQAVMLAQYPHLLYVCANHGRCIDPSWPLDLLVPLDRDMVAMTGSLQDSGPPENLGFPPELPPLHIQGGVFAARTELLRRHPYPTGKYAHYGSDIYLSLRLVQAGWQLVDVPTIQSVWRRTAGDGDWKYVHDVR
jgi:hypothetical protein